MRTVTLAVLNLTVMAALAAGPATDAWSAPEPSPQDQQSVATEDIVYLTDGRVLAGQILSEEDGRVVFEFADHRFNIKTKLTIHEGQIVKIERDVPVEDEPAEQTTPTSRTAPKGGTTKPADGSFVARLNSKAASDDPSLPGIYVIPMKGQMGTDIHVDVYEELMNEIRSQNPDLVVWLLDCSDTDQLMISMSEKAEQGLMKLDKYRGLVNLLKDDMGDIPQMMWVHDSVGISSVVALAWADMYMTPTARMDGLWKVWAGAAGWSDDDVRAKMVAAWMGIANGFLENGGYPLELGKAMMNPNYQLSATWKGREVEWRLDDSGEYLVDGSEKSTSRFRAKTAEDFCISDGTAETIDDLMLLRGYREFRLIAGEAPGTLEEYVEDWRAAFEKTKTLWIDYQQHLGWAGGDEALQWLGRAKRDLEQIISAMERYEAVEIRWQIEQGMGKFDLEKILGRLKEQIRALRQQGRGGAGGPGGGGGGRPGGGGGPGGR
jgi:hypothetical protein